ncbi:ATP-binding protein [Streptomyces fructofermentans]|uniref:Histidine kinase/HSP90-like ATPase domain-containing protein n=1 Tax=Streptomyces fructofermentans TaxID=152141 RepID=A0A918K7F2_9ACTN|nr:ATP-binding protein [Streptomyces fructofermentans]GGX51453.1 hypothetical protein GCM10010515_18300 [Streptomyces fructofermentans]
MFGLTPEPASVSAARRNVRELLTEWGTGPETRDNALLVVSELVTNALTHTASEWIVCRLRTFRGRLHIEVEDRHRGRTLPAPRPAGPDDQDGRGLMLVGALSSDWGVRDAPRGGGSIVWAVLPDLPVRCQEAPERVAPQRRAPEPAGPRHRLPGSGAPERPVERPEAPGQPSERPAVSERQVERPAVPERPAVRPAVPVRAAPVPVVPEPSPTVPQQRRARHTGPAGHLPTGPGLVPTGHASSLTGHAPTPYVTRPAPHSAEGSPPHGTAARP